ncbi:Tetratricopeptide-like helical domain [Phytophthora cactorum]|nr:Tetratricopeptide-like helical domain [Phytophthora cactorum]
MGSGVANNTSASSPKIREHEALNVFNKALSLYAELGDQKQVASTHYQIASFYRRMISNAVRAETEKSDGPSSTLTSQLADLHILGGQVEGIEHALLILLNTYEAFSLAASRDSKLETEEMASLARTLWPKLRLFCTSLSDSVRVDGSACSHKKQKARDVQEMYKEVIYYDGYSAGSIVPILGTLRGIKYPSRSPYLFNVTHSSRSGPEVRVRDHYVVDTTRNTG